IFFPTSRSTDSSEAPAKVEVYNSAKTTSAPRASSRPRRVTPFSSCKPRPMKTSSPMRVRRAERGTYSLSFRPRKNARNRENPLGPGLIVRSVRSWALVVPRERAEDIRRRLLDRDLLQKHLRIASEGETVLLPIRRQVEMGFPTAEKDF